MADPRAVVERRGILYDAETYAHDSTITYDASEKNGSAQVGKAVAQTSMGVKVAAADEIIEGVLIKVEDDGFCTVQNRGNAVVQIGANATAALIVGAKAVGDADGGVKEAAATDVTEVTVIQIIDATEVVVRLR